MVQPLPHHAQPRWPVHLDHCFARIILDNTVGQGTRQWDHVIGKPALRSMSDEQLREAIELGGKIEKGEVDLVELDERSLSARAKLGKSGNGDSHHDGATVLGVFKSEEGQFLARSKKRKSEVLDAESTTPKKTKQATLSFSSKSDIVKHIPTPSSPAPAPTADLLPIHARIQSHPTLTPYRKRLYSALLTVPRGQHTTYAAMSDYLHSSARAVGNGMRNNPFAPEVPCHRVLAADGSIGGFHGDWGKDGKYANDKITLLKGEGVRFDGRGRVKGQVWRGFYEIG
jgi:O-6-methylguanine DNA methyltransferase